MIEVGKLIREARAGKGLSQGDISKAIRLTTPQYVSNIERSLTLPSPRVARVIIKLLNISLVYFMGAYRKDLESQIEYQVNKYKMRVHK